MLPEERQNMIVQLVNEHGAVSVKELSARFAVTDDSIRKDLTLLQRNGRLKKTYGGALKIEPDDDHFVSQRKPKYRPAKQKIAKKVLKLLKDGDTIFLDISTTNIEVAKLLKTSGLSLTVVTNMVDVMLAMAGDDHSRLIFAGGKLSDADKDAVMHSLERAYWLSHPDEKPQTLALRHRRKQSERRTASCPARTSAKIFHLIKRS